jgi:hypothetical protein
MILKPEIKTQSRTGRTKHISELRSELANITVKKSLFSRVTSRNYNPLPDYEEFFNKFLDKDYSPGFTAESYSVLLSTSVLGTVRLNSGLATNIYTIIQKLTKLPMAEIVGADKQAEKQDKAAEEAVAAEPVPVPQEVVNDLKETKDAVQQAYAKDGQALPGQVAEGQTGGGWYENQTVLENPNQVVYSCSQITAPIPFAGCHMGYMGVGYTGAAASVGSFSSTRGYREEAVLYNTNGLWTFSPDSLPAQAPPLPPRTPPSASTTPSDRTPLLPPTAPPKTSLFDRLRGRTASQAPTAKKGWWGGTAKRRKMRKARKTRR